MSSFYAAALKSRARDEWLGWHPRDRIGRLHLITNQSRFLVLEPIPNLASRTLSLLARQVVRGWLLRFGYPLLMMETFVDPAAQLRWLRRQLPPIFKLFTSLSDLRIARPTVCH